MTMIIRVEEPERATRVCRSSEHRVLIGRSVDCDVVLSHSTASLRHAELTIRGGWVHVRDLGSTNGTWTAEGRVSETWLAPGNSVHLGHVVVQLMMVVNQDRPPEPLDELPTTIAGGGLSIAPRPSVGRSGSIAEPAYASAGPMASAEPVQAAAPMLQGAVALDIAPPVVAPQVEPQATAGTIEAPPPDEFLPPIAPPPSEGEAPAARRGQGPANLHGLFPRALRSLEEDRFKVPLIAVVVAFVVVLGWGIWAVSSTTPVYVVSSEAKVEALASAHQVAALYGGRISDIRVKLGDVVQSGEVLFVLDDTDLRLQRAEVERQRDVLSAQIGPLEKQIEAEERAIASSTRVAEAAEREAKARAGAAGARAAHWSRERKALRELAEAGVARVTEASEAGAHAAEGGLEARAHLSAAERMRWQSEVDASSREALVESLRRELISTRERIEEMSASLETFDHKIDQCRVRAPTGGRIGDVGKISTGAVVTGGQMLASIVPDGDLRVVGSFPAGEALGRVRPGQPARLRLAAFPWTQYGMVEGEVSQIASESVNGGVRVVISIDPASNPKIALEHGLDASAEIEVEEVSPLELILRAAGKSAKQDQPQAEGSDP